MSEPHPPPLTLCLDCGARRPGIGGSNCLACGSTALELRTGHLLREASEAGAGGAICVLCGTYPPKTGRTEWFGVDGWFGRGADLPDCETVSAGWAEENSAERNK